MTSPVDRPVFITGCGRSGTTLAYELLAQHPDVGWFSNYTDRLPWLPQLAALSRFYPFMGVDGRRGALKPSEGHRLWAYCSPRSPEDELRRLTEEDASSYERRRIHRTVRAHLRYQGRVRFLNKNVRLTHRLRHLNALFDDARVIHVLRDPRPTVSSLLRVAFWARIPLWWHNGQTPVQLIASGFAPEILAAEVWREQVLCATKDASQLGASRYLEVRYEHLVKDPATTVSTILDFAELRCDPKFLKSVESFPIKDTSGNYRRYLSSEQIQQVETTAGAVARKLGYQLDSDH
jgi:omega-hydroxy-beta-dihydromenaquinone-9 sulfotransferase